MARKDRFFQMRVDEDFLSSVDDIRREEPDLPSRARMARRLIELACAATELQQLLKSGSRDASGIAFGEVMERLPTANPSTILKELQARVTRKHEAVDAV